MKRLAAVLSVPALAGFLVAVPGTAVAADASYRSLNTASNPDWMRGLGDSTSLAALSLPGTHETMAIRGGALTQTQENYGDSGASLSAQLAAGIRMIDIRARVNTGNTFTIHHGATYQNANFDDVLGALSGFLAAHPGETVVLRLKQECTGEIGSCTDASGQSSFPDIFDAYAARRPGLFWAPRSPGRAPPPCRAGGGAGQGGAVGDERPARRPVPQLRAGAVRRLERRLVDLCPGRVRRPQCRGHRHQTRPGTAFPGRHQRRRPERDVRQLRQRVEPFSPRPSRWPEVRSGCRG